MKLFKTYLKVLDGEQCWTMFQIALKYYIQMDVVSPLVLIEFLKTFLVKEWPFIVQLYQNLDFSLKEYQNHFLVEAELYIQFELNFCATVSILQNYNWITIPSIVENRVVVCECVTSLLFHILDSSCHNEIHFTILSFAVTEWFSEHCRILSNYYLSKPEPDDRDSGRRMMVDTVIKHSYHLIIRVCGPT